MTVVAKIAAAVAAPWPAPDNDVCGQPRADQGLSWRAEDEARARASGMRAMASLEAGFIAHASAELVQAAQWAEGWGQAAQWAEALRALCAGEELGLAVASLRDVCSICTRWAPAPQCPCDDEWEDRDTYELAAQGLTLCHGPDGSHA